MTRDILSTEVRLCCFLAEIIAIMRPEKFQSGQPQKNWNDLEIRERTNFDTCNGNCRVASFESKWFYIFGGATLEVVDLQKNNEVTIVLIYNILPDLFLIHVHHSVKRNVVAWLKELMRVSNASVA